MFGKKNKKKPDFDFDFDDEDFEYFDEEEEEEFVPEKKPVKEKKGKHEELKPVSSVEADDSENEHSHSKNEWLKKQVEHLRHEVENKQLEIDKLTLAASSGSKNDDYVRSLEERLEEAEKKVSEQEIMKAQIADVLVIATQQSKEITNKAKLEADRKMGNAKEQANGILSEANFESKHIIADANAQADKIIGTAKDDLQFVKREAEEYYQHLLRAQEKSKLLYSQLIRKTEQVIGNEKSEKEDNLRIM
ncbi:MAG: hypothetical protein LBM95_04370 [Lactobacillales bacterium]|jgi:cell division septum initiation protein DivIVA|nr:hypothetical protein [Lactobacillales bacterium]